MSDARAEILGRIRSALGDTPVPPDVARDYGAAGCPVGFKAFWKSCDAMIVLRARLRVMG